MHAVEQEDEIFPGAAPRGVVEDEAMQAILGQSPDEERERGDAGEPRERKLVNRNASP